MDVLTEDNLVSQYVHLGSIFFAIAIVVWTSVAVWLCYSGSAHPPLDQLSGDRKGLDSEQYRRDRVKEAIGSNFTEVFVDGKPRGPLTSTTFESFLRGGKSNVEASDSSSSRADSKDVTSAFLSHYYPELQRQDGKSGNSASTPSTGRRQSSSSNTGRLRPDDLTLQGEGQSRSGGHGKLSLLTSCLKRLLLPSSSSLNGMGSQYSGHADDQLRGDILDSSTAVLNMADQARSIGNKYLKEKEFSAAAHSYEVACMLANSLKPFPKTEMATFHCNCALACQELGRFGDAINECHAALVLSPPKHLAVKALYRLAVSHASLNNAFEARRCLRRCLKLDPLNVYAQFFLEELGQEEQSATASNPVDRKKFQLNWASLPKKGQGAAGSAGREKARGKKGKAKAATTCDGFDPKFDRDAGMWHTVTACGRKLYILGGCGDPAAATGVKAPTISSTLTEGALSSEALKGSDELHVLDTDTLELRRLTGLNSKCPVPCCCHAAVMAGTNLVACGGLTSTSSQSGNAAAFVVVYDTVQGKWKTPTVTGANPRQRLGMTLNAIPAKCLNSSNSSSNNNNNGSNSHSNSHSSSHGHGYGSSLNGGNAAALDAAECVCLFGGLEPQGDLPLGRVYNDVHFLDLDSFSWRKIEVGGFTPPARFGHSTTNLPGPSTRLLVIGGRDTLSDSFSESFTDMHILDVKGRFWSQPTYSGSPPLRACYHTASLLSDTCLAVCASGPTVDTPDTLPVHLLDLSDWSWSAPAPGGGAGPAPRIGHAAASVGSKLFIFGGATGQGPTLVDKTLHILELSSTVAEAEASSSPVGTPQGPCATPFQVSSNSAARGIERLEAEFAGNSRVSDPSAHFLQPIVNADKVTGESHSFGYDKAFVSLETSSNSTTTTNGKGVHSAPTSRDERVEMMLRDHPFDEIDEDSEPELSFEELLAKEKAYFQTEKLSFPRPSPSTS